MRNGTHPSEPDAAALAPASVPESHDAFAMTDDDDGAAPAAMSPPEAPNADPIPQGDAAKDEPAAAEDTHPTAKTPLHKLTVPQLRGRYVQVVGCPTASLHRRYLIWKSQQADQGQIPVGPRPLRKREGEPSDSKMLPLRMHNDHVEQLDQARLRLGMASRMDLFRRALHVYLEQ